jgi:hypothetical protein
LQQQSKIEPTLTHAPEGNRATAHGAVPLRYKLFVVALMVAVLTATITFEVFVRIT